MLSAALRVLQSDANTPDLFSRKIQLINSLLSDDGPDPMQDYNICSSLTWIASNRVMWMDINAFTSIKSSSHYAPFPEPLTLQEWLMLGQSTRQDDVESEIVFLESTLTKHLDSSLSLYQASNCPREVIAEILAQDNASLEKKSRYETVSMLMYQFISPRYSYYSDPFASMSGICSHLIETILYVNATIASSKDLTDISHNYLKLASTSDDSTSPYRSYDIKGIIQESFRLQRRSLAEAYRFVYSTTANTESDGFQSYGESQPNDKHLTAASVMMSDKAMNYLSYLSSRMVRLVRYFIAPPAIISKNSFPSKSFENRDLWTEMLPNVIYPWKIDFTVYLISITSKPNSQILLKSFDYNQFYHEIQRFSLKNQELSMTTHVVSLDGETDLYLGLELCQTFDPISNHAMVLNGPCMLSYIFKQEIDIVFASDFDTNTAMESPFELIQEEKTSKKSPSRANGRKTSSDKQEPSKKDRFPRRDGTKSTYQEMSRVQHVVNEISLNIQSLY